MYQARFSGELPETWREALAELKTELGILPAETGVPIVCQRGEILAVDCDGKTVTVTWPETAGFFRALSHIPVPLAPCHIREKARFHSCGVMLDCSRNAVLKPEALRGILRKMALMGLNLGMLYTEDTYEVPEQPFFGYKRGRYTYAELKELDDYAHMLGIELCPCIQTLGHLQRMLHWPVFQPYRDNESVLLADWEETYVLLEQMIRAASAPYRSRRIHLGMDEAYGVGLGNHLTRFGYEHPHQVMGRHLRRVLDITDKYGLEAMMWSDMYFSLDGRGYYDEGMPSQRAVEAVDPRVSLVYWDYYHGEFADYAGAFRRHAQFRVPTIFAGGLWTWVGPAPSYATAIHNTVPGLLAAMEAGTETVFATAWGDNGAECNLTAALLGLQLYAEMDYTGEYDERALHARFRRCCGADARAFLDLEGFNAAPGLAGYPNFPSNACKFLLYQDPLVQLFEKDTEELALAEHFAALSLKYARYARENPEYALLLDFYTALGHALSLKCRWHQLAGPAVRTGNRAQAAELAEGVPATVEALHALRAVWRRLWESTNKPNGYEIIDARLGGIAARMETAGEKMASFAHGETPTIPELMEKCLPTRRRADGTMHCVNLMSEIATAGTIDGV